MTANRDRYGEVVDQDETELEPGQHDPECIDGWLPDTWDGRPNPCLTCRPWITDSRRRLRRQLEGPPQR